MTKTQQLGPFAVFGGGNMARAILLQGVQAGVIDPSLACIAEPDESKRAAFADAGFVVFATAPEAAQAADAFGDAPAAWLVAVKPQIFPGVAHELATAKCATAGRTIISIMAGLTTSRLAEALRCRSSTGIVRTMPNLGATVGKGVTAIANDSGASEDALAAASRLMASLGPCVEFVPESLLDCFTAVAGSGPAYIFYLAEAMTEAAIALGFSPESADRIVRGTIDGASALLAESSASPTELRASVTSRGGTTFAAIESLDRDEVRAAIVRAIEAGTARSKELAG